MTIHVPDGYHTINAYQVVHRAALLIAFAKQAFDAEQLECITRPDGTVGHAELRIGDSVLMITEASDEWAAMPATLYIYVPDCDAIYKRALLAGGESVSEPETQFYGDRHAAVRGPCHDLWWIATRIEALVPEELQRRAK